MIKIGKHYCQICSMEHEGTHIEWDEDSFKELDIFLINNGKNVSSNDSTPENPGA